MFLVNNYFHQIISIFLSECNYSDPNYYYCNSSVVAGTGFIGSSKTK